MLGAPAARVRRPARRGSRSPSGRADATRVGLAVGEVVESAARPRARAARPSGTARTRCRGRSVVVEADRQLTAPRRENTRARSPSSSHARWRPRGAAQRTARRRPRQLRRLARAGHRVPLARDPAGGQHERESASGGSAGCRERRGFRTGAPDSVLKRPSRTAGRCRVRLECGTATGSCPRVQPRVAHAGLIAGAARGQRRELVVDLGGVVPREAVEAHPARRRPAKISQSARASPGGSTPCA